MSAVAPILSTGQMAAAEQAIFDAGVDEYDLMVRAGEGAAQEIWRLAGNHPVLILAGPGNNGGDGYVVARWLADKGADVCVAALTEPKTIAAQKARKAYSGTICDFTQIEGHYPIIVDALFGTGQDRELDPACATILTKAMEQSQYSFAIDIPTGVDSDSGERLTALPAFDCCLAIGAWKNAHFWGESATVFASKLLIPIGVDPPQDAIWTLPKPFIGTPKRSDHKYNRGLVAIMAGQMTGAAILAASAAARSGAGYVKIIGQSVAPANLPPELVWVFAPSQADLNAALQDERIDTLLVGPGLGRDSEAALRLGLALSRPFPLMLDADAITLLSRKSFAERRAPIVLSPHDGEFSGLYKELMGCDANISHAASSRIQASHDIVKNTGASLVHKGVPTLISAPSRPSYCDDRGSPWLSTAGTGDVLAGLIASRLAVHGDPHSAASEAQWLHSRASQLAGPAFTAGDLIAYIPMALAECL